MPDPVTEPVKIGEALAMFAKFADGLDHFTGPNTPGTYVYTSSVVGTRLLVPGDFRRAAAASAHLEENRERWVAALRRADGSLYHLGFTTQSSDRAALREIMAWIGGDNG